MKNACATAAAGRYSRRGAGERPPTAAAARDAWAPFAVQLGDRPRDRLSPSGLERHRVTGIRVPRDPEGVQEVASEGGADRLMPTVPASTCCDLEAVY